MAFNRNLNRTFLALAFVFYLLSGLFDWMLIGNEEIGDVGSDICFYGLSVMMFAFPIKYYQGVISFGATIMFFINSYFSGAMTHFVLTSSGNYISVLLILGVSLYYIGMHNSGKKFTLVDIVPPILCFLLSIWARGRGGIISTAFLLGLVAMAYFWQKRKDSSKLYKVLRILLVVAIAVIVVVGVNIAEEFLSLGKIGTEGFETPRPFMWASYFNKMMESPIYVLLGAPLDQVPPIHELGNNCHNSFLQLHAFNGIIVFFGFAYILYRSIVFFYKKKLLALLVITLTIVVRGMTDKFIFGQYGMPIMLYLAFYPFAYKRNGLNLDTPHGT